jgi:FkbM family methyltransferase
MSWISFIMDEADKLWKLLSATKLPIILFGAGDKGKGAYKFLSEKGIKIECFCDNNNTLTLTHYREIPIYSYDIIRYLYSQYVMLLTVTETKFSFLESQIESYCDKNMRFHFCIPFDLSDTFLSRDILIKGKKKFSVIYDKLADDLSRNVLRETILYKATGNAEHVFSLIDGNCNFDRSLFSSNGDTVYVDLYYSNINSIFQFLSFCRGQYNSIIAITPVLNQYKKLQTAVRENDISNVELHHAAYWSNPDIMNIPFVAWPDNEENDFYAEDNCFVYDRSKITHRSSLQQGIAKYKMTAEVISLDAILKNRKATLIRITSIGNDFEIIKGMEHTIRKFKPHIIIEYGCSVDDLTRIPTFLWELRNDYKIYLREKVLGGSYTFMLYAV